MRPTEINNLADAVWYAKMVYQSGRPKSSKHASQTGECMGREARREEVIWARLGKRPDLDFDNNGNVAFPAVACKSRLQGGHAA